MRTWKRCGGSCEKPPSPSGAPDLDRSGVVQTRIPAAAAHDGLVVTAPVVVTHSRERGLRERRAFWGLDHDDCRGLFATCSPALTTITSEHRPARLFRAISAGATARTHHRAPSLSVHPPSPVGRMAATRERHRRMSTSATLTRRPRVRADEVSPAPRTGTTPP